MHLQNFEKLQSQKIAPIRFDGLGQEKSREISEFSALATCQSAVFFVPASKSDTQHGTSFRTRLHRRVRSKKNSSDDTRNRDSNVSASRRRQVTSALTCSEAPHSRPSPFESIISKKIIGIRILASRRRSVRLGSDAPQAPRFTTEPVRIPDSQKKRDTSWVLFSFGCGIGIRTPTNRVRVCRATVTQFRFAVRTV